MPSYNRCIFIGHCTKDPIGKEVGETTIAEFGIGVNHKFKDKEEVLFLDCAAFGKTAETILKFFHKGDPILVEGRLKLDVWDDRNGGGKRYKHSLVVENFRFVGARGDGDGQQQETPRSSRPTGGGKPVRREPVAPPFGDEKQFEEADIPF